MRVLLITGGMVAPLLLGGVVAAQQTQEAPEPALEEVDENQPVEVEVVPEGTEVEEAEEPVEVTPEGEPMEAEPVEAEVEQAAPAEVEVQDVEVQEVEEQEVLSPEAEQAIVREQAPNELRVDWITGTTIVSPEDETIGRIQDLILDQDSGQITAAIIGVGGLLGIGAKQIAVDFAELQIDYDAQEVMLNLTRDEADLAPEYVFREQEEAPVPAGTDPGMQTQPGLTPTAPETEMPAEPAQ